MISNTGSWMQRVAQDWLVLELTHGSGAALGITTGLQFLPLLLFSLWGGMVADRYSKRLILMMTQAAAGGLALILGLLALTGTVQIWHVYALAFALGLVTVVDNPTRQAFAAEMVGRGGMPNAIALNSAVFNLARIAGPAVAGLVISAVGTPAAFLVNAASYAAVLISLKLMRPDELHVVQRLPRAKGQLREAMSYVKQRPTLWMPMVLIFFVSTFGMNFQVTNALMARQVFHTGAGAFGLRLGCVRGRRAGRGPACRPARPADHGAAAGDVVRVQPAGDRHRADADLLGLPGAAGAHRSHAAHASPRPRTPPRSWAPPPDMRGRVMGLYLLLFLGGTPLGSPLAGWVAEVFGPRMCMITGGLISVVATAVIGFMLVRSEGVRARDYLRPARLARMVA